MPNVATMAFLVLIALGNNVDGYIDPLEIDNKRIK
jgi:hypothetical protein